VNLTPQLQRKLIVEFIGTFFLVLVVGLVTAPKTHVGALGPLAVGSVLMVMVFAGGHISGGHYNPAVSTGVMIRGRLAHEEWAAYMVVQLVAGIVAGVVASMLVGSQSAAVLPGVGKVLLAEFLFTFALVYVVLNVATARATEGNSFYGLAIGFTVVAGAFAVGSISGAAFNPAVVVGQIVHGSISVGHIWEYWLAQFLAGAALEAAPTPHPR
jgi:aquaporin Z